LAFASAGISNSIAMVSALVGWIRKRILRQLAPSRQWREPGTDDDADGRHAQAATRDAGIDRRRSVDLPVRTARGGKQTSIQAGVRDVRASRESRHN
jgi:hypothetical protein